MNTKKFTCHFHLSISLLIVFCSLQVHLLLCTDQYQSSSFPPIAFALTDNDKPSLLRKSQHKGTETTSFLTASNKNSNVNKHHNDEHQKLRMLNNHNSTNTHTGNNHHKNQNKKNHDNSFGNDSSTQSPTSSPIVVNGGTSTSTSTSTSTTQHPTIASTTKENEENMTSSPTFQPTPNPTSKTTESKNDDNPESNTSIAPTPSPTKTKSINQPPSPNPTYTITSTTSPSTPPTQYIPFFEREKNKAKEEEEQIIQLIHDPTADILATIFALSAIIGMLYTAQQIFEHPDGLCASCCRLSLTVTSLCIRLLCVPCTLICGYRYKGYTGSDPNNKAVFLQAEEYTNELELT
jgi:hypothetical protein